MTLILDGLNLSRKTEEELKQKISKFEKSPKLAIVQVGKIKESEIYIERKIKYAQKIGALTEHVRMPESVSQNDLEKRLGELNEDSTVHGIIIQLPLPVHLNFFSLVEKINPKKDVDGLGSQNLKRLWQNESSSLMPATVRGVLELLEEYKISISGKKVVVINRSILVGRPLAIALLNRDATVSICHSKTKAKTLKEEIQSADIVVSAIGKPKIFGREFFREGQVVIDVGISYGNQKIMEEKEGPKISGDVDFLSVKDIVYAISPVPGGVGPMTVACLFKNLLKAYDMQTK